MFRTKFHSSHSFLRNQLLVALLGLLLAGCGASAGPIIPTQRPTASATFTGTPTSEAADASPTPTATSPDLTVTAGPSPTALFGPAPTSVAAVSTATRVPNPNAPRIEFFTSDTLAVAPGDAVTLFWSTRGSAGAVITRTDTNQLWNVPPDGKLSTQTRRRDRGQITFVLSVGEGDLNTQQSLVIPLSCPDAWFFQPPPDACPTGAAEQTTLVEQPFDRGRMVYVQSRNKVYALFNDGRQPAWVSFENRYNPAKDPELDENFEKSLPPGKFQPLRALGFVWRGNDTVRNRLGLGLQAEARFDGFVQSAPTADGKENLYLNSSDGSVLQLLPGGDEWQIITLR
jgi:hypothetical protein